MTSKLLGLLGLGSSFNVTIALYSSELLNANKSAFVLSFDVALTMARTADHDMLRSETGSCISNGLLNMMLHFAKDLSNDSIAESDASRFVNWASVEDGAVDGSAEGELEWKDAGWKAKLFIFMFSPFVRAFILSSSFNYSCDIRIDSLL